MNKKTWLTQVFIAIDQVFNAIFGGFADETLSSRAHRQQGKKWYWFLLRRFIDLLFFWQKNHCEEAFLSERLGRHHPEEIRDSRL